MYFLNDVIFFSQVVILEHKSIICPGYTAVLHIHNAVEEVTLIVRTHFLTCICFFHYSDTAFTGKCDQYCIRRSICCIEFPIKTLYYCFSYRIYCLYVSSFFCLSISPWSQSWIRRPVKEVKLGQGWLLDFC